MAAIEYGSYYWCVVLNGTEQDAAGEYAAAARTGRRGAAPRRFKSYAEILKRKLRVAPDAETRALAKEIARSRGASDPNALLA